MRKVMAQGTFDILHPGHLHYLRESADKGDELTVVVARDSRVGSTKDLHFNENERKKMLESIEYVDKAILGSEGNIYETVREVDPDIITLGYDQPHRENEVSEMAKEATGHKVDVARITQKKDYSSTKIRNHSA